MLDLTSQPNMNPRELAEVFVEEFKSEHLTELWATLSAIDVSQITDLSNAIDEFSQLLLNKLDTYKTQIRDARSEVKEYFNREKDYPFDKIDWNSIDLQHFAELIKEKISDNNIKNSADKVMNGITKTVIDEWHNIAHTNTHGLSIYFPDLKTEFYPKIRDDYAKLDFSALNWNDFLWKYLDQTYAVVFVGSKTINQEVLEGVAIQIDGEVHTTPFRIDLLKGEHTFLSPSWWIDWRNLQIFVFDRWEEMIDNEVITVSTEVEFTSNVQNEKTLYTVFKPFISGTTITLEESEERLYLHVYDDQGRHVGLNYEQNQSEIGISGAYYFDDLNGTTVIVLPPEILAFRILVDAKQAEQRIERYNLTVTRIMDSQILDMKSLLSTVNKSEIQEYTTLISSDGKIDLSRAINVPWWQLHWYVIVFVSAASVFGVLYLLLKRRKLNRSIG